MDKVNLRTSDKPPALMIMPSRLGDALLTTSVLRQLEDYAVTLVVDPLVQDVFDAFPMVVTRVSMPKEPRSFHWVRLRRQVRTKFKRIIDLRGSWVSKTWPFADSSVWNSTFKDKGHKVKQVCACAGLPVQEPYVWTRNLPAISSSYPDVILAPAANWMGKQWPLERFRQLAESLLHQYPNIHIGYVCALHERDGVKSVWEGLPRSYLFDGSLSLGQIAALFQQAKFFVGNDSGLMHLAVATQLPAVALFGPTQDAEYGPFEIDSYRHRVVRGESYKAICARPGYSPSATTCYMDTLSIEDVWLVVQERANALFSASS